METNVLNKYNERMLEKQEHTPPNSEEVNKVFRTSDYSIFRLADDDPKYRGKNRIVKESHANTVGNDIKEHGQIEPILVRPIYNDDGEWIYYQVIQGQHRFTDCEKKNIPILFMVHSNYETEDMTRAHLLHKSHSWKDYLRKWISDGRQDYVTYQKFITDHDIGHDAALCVLDGKDHDAKNLLKEKFNTGNLILDIDNLKYAEKLLDNINTLKPYCDPKYVDDIVGHKFFIIAMMRLMNDKNRKNFGSWKGFEVLRSKLEGVRNLCISYNKDINGYLDNIESIFNHGAQRQNRIYFV